MTRLVSMALFDPDGQVAPHVRRTIEQLARPDTTLVAHATHPLDADAAAWVRERAELVERENVGLDFYGHRQVLDNRGLRGFDEVVITNDTFALLKPLEAIEASIDPEADFWGLTISREVAPHVQSYFVAFRSPAVRHPVFAEHWAGVEPKKRRAVIRDNEVGLSVKLARAGLLMDAAFRPTAADRRRAQVRCLRHGWSNPRSLFGQWNPLTVLQDAAFDARLPLAKISTLRYDPMKLGAEHLLTELERRFPAEMEGVRVYLQRTASAYGR